MRTKQVVSVSLGSSKRDVDHSFQLLLQQLREGDESIVWITEEQGREVRHVSEPLAGPWDRFWRDVLSVVVPEHML